MSCDGSKGNSSVETMLTEGPTGYSSRRSYFTKTYHAIFWVAGAKTLTVPLSIKSWILYLKIQQLMVSCLGASMC